MARKKKHKLVIRREWCKGCTICIEFCPAQVLALDELEKVIVVHAEACTECQLCEIRCPDLAIELRPLTPEELAALEAPSPDAPAAEVKQP